MGVSAHDRWHPDDQLVAAILANGGRRITDLSPPDRCWAVAGLILSGLTAEDMADRLGCSVRLIRAVRADPMTQVCVYAQTETRHFADEMSLARSELKSGAADLHRTRRELRSAQLQIARLVTFADADTCSHGHPFDNGNTYWHGGRRHCRACRRRRQSDYRVSVKRR